MSIGYTPRLTRIPPAAEEDIDVLFYGALVDRRLRVLRALRSEGVAVTARSEAEILRAVLSAG